MTRQLTLQDLQGKSKAELELMRNEIFARHGRRFKRQGLQKYFESQTWYRGQYTPEEFHKIGESLLSEVQKKNVRLLLEYEQRH